MPKVSRKTDAFRAGNQKSNHAAEVRFTFLSTQRGAIVYLCTTILHVDEPLSESNAPSGPQLSHAGSEQQKLAEKKTFATSAQHNIYSFFSILQSLNSLKFWFLTSTCFFPIQRVLVSVLNFFLTLLLFLVWPWLSSFVLFLALQKVNV